jgi:endonuclease YncB( thermonuclease family)
MTRLRSRARGSPSKEKYGRLLAQVIVPGHILHDDLVTAGLAVDYSGGKRALRALPGEPDPVDPVP